MRGVMQLGFAKQHAIDVQHDRDEGDHDKDCQDGDGDAMPGRMPAERMENSLKKMGNGGAPAMAATESNEGCAGKRRDPEQSAHVTDLAGLKRQQDEASRIKAKDLVRE